MIFGHLPDNLGNLAKESICIFVAATTHYIDGYTDPRGTYFDRPVYKTSRDFTIYDVPLWGWIIIGVLIMLVISLCIGVATLELIALWKRSRNDRN